MNQSRSLDVIKTQFMNNSELSELPPRQRKLILKQFKKLYSQQMGKVFIEINRRNKVKSNKTQIQDKQQQQAKEIQQKILTKMQKHNQKREKAFDQKVNHFKMMDQNWKLKIQSINRKKTQENKKSFQKALQYRKLAQNFWAQSQKRNKRVASQSKFSEQNYHDKIRDQFKDLNKQSPIKHDQAYVYKRKSQSKNELSNVVQTTLPTIKKHSYHLNRFEGKNNQILMHKSYHKFIDEKKNQQHVEKSKNIANEKEELALYKALEKMKLISEKRQKCRKERQKSIKEVKEKRSLKQEVLAHAQRRKRIEQKQLQQRASKQKSTQRNESSLNKNQNSRFYSCNKPNSLDESIIKHREAKYQQEEQQFQSRGEMLRENMMRQKKGKMLRLVKQTINKMRKQALSKC